MAQITHINGIPVGSGGGGGTSSKINGLFVTDNIFVNNVGTDIVIGYNSSNELTGITTTEISGVKTTVLSRDVNGYITGCTVVKDSYTKTSIITRDGNGMVTNVTIS